MKDAPASSANPANPSQDERLAALFANLVLQQTNMALVFLGKTAQGESGQSLFDLDSAQLVIDQLEMLKIKTQGNRTPNEDHLLEQSLMTVRMAFVQAVNAPADSPPQSPNAPPATAPSPATPSPATSAAATGTEAPPSPDESRKKFTKKYGV